MKYTVKGAAEYLNMSVSGVYKLVEAGIIQGKKYGSVWRFTQEQLDNPIPQEKANGSLQGFQKRKLAL